MIPRSKQVSRDDYVALCSTEPSAFSRSVISYSKPLNLALGQRRTFISSFILQRMGI